MYLPTSQMGAFFYLELPNQERPLRLFFWVSGAQQYLEVFQKEDKSVDISKENLVVFSSIICN